MITATVLSLLLILAVSAFFSGSETALMSLNRYRLRHLERKQRAAARVREVLAYPEKVLGTILIGNIFINTAAAALITYAVTLLVISPDRKAQAVLIATIVLTGLILVFGEMVPKSFAARHPEQWSFVAIRPIVLLIRILGPAVRLLTLISNGFLRLFGEVPRPLQSKVTLEEIRAIVYAGGEAEDERGGKREMLRKVFELGERRVAEVMVPRTEIVAIEVDASLEEIVSLIQKRRFSRMPVYRKTLDTIEGLVYSKDIIAYWGAQMPFQLSQVLRKSYFLPDGAKIEQALEQMQKHRVHMALVVDEHGGVEGLVTLEDMLEEIVGELSDEREEGAPSIKRLADGQYLLDGSIPLKDLNERLGLQLPERPDYNTLAGFILTCLGRIPVEGEELAAGGMVLAVDKVAGRRIVRVKARPLRTTDPETPIPDDGGSGHGGH
ncbi:MAG: hemolysin family protein [Acidobacteriota bacterium]